MLRFKDFAGSEQYRSASPQQQAQMRDEYFETYLAPRIPVQHYQSEKQRFLSLTGGVPGAAEGERSMSRSHAPAWECISPLTTVDSLSIIHHNQDNLLRLSISNAQPRQHNLVSPGSTVSGRVNTAIQCRIVIIIK